MDLYSCEGIPILEQLKFEEALLRAGSQNACFINIGSPQAIVMGSGGKVDNLVEVSLAKRDNIPIIKRFSGGGTVFIDENTLFVSFVFNKDEIPTSPFPKSIMEWSKEFYKGLFIQDNFNLIENDYVWGEKKFGGNAQYIQKDRWLHHTSFLWDFDEEKMNYLKMPPKIPVYRKGRSHHNFLCAMRTVYPDKYELIESLKRHLKTLFAVEEKSLSALSPLLEQNYRKTTEKLNI